MELTRQAMFGGKPVRRVHVMVKTIGSMCNLDCTYCYYLPKGELLGVPRHWAMSEETLETFIRQYFEANNHKEVVFSWQSILLHTVERPVDDASHRILSHYVVSHQICRHMST